MSKTTVQTTTSFREMQADRLNAINAELKRHRLPLLRRLGNYKNGEIELIEILEIRVTPYFAQIQYLVVQPDGNRGTFYVQSGIGTDELKPNIIIPTLNGTHLVMLQQHRPTMLSQGECWMTEFPRGFVSNDLHPTILDHKIQQSLADKGDAPFNSLRLLGRKLATLLSRSDVTMRHMYRLDTDPGICENTGTSSTLYNVFWLELETKNPAAVMESIPETKALRVVFIPIEKIQTQAERTAQKIHGAFELTALLLWKEFRSERI